jgi:hypothetical protein
MTEEYMLFIGDMKFLLSLEEAMQVALVLNASQRVSPEWLNGVPSGRNHVVKRPDPAAAVVAPMTAIFRMELETNQRLLEEKK